jgi:hypothetical protein
MWAILVLLRLRDKNEKRVVEPIWEATQVEKVQVKIEKHVLECRWGGSPERVTEAVRPRSGNSS